MQMKCVVLGVRHSFYRHKFFANLTRTLRKSEEKTDRQTDKVS